MQFLDKFWIPRASVELCRAIVDNVLGDIGGVNVSFAIDNEDGDRSLRILERYLSSNSRTSIVLRYSQFSGTLGQNLHP